MLFQYVHKRAYAIWRCMLFNLQNSFLFIIFNHFPERNGFYKRVSGLFYNSNKSYLSTSCINSIHNVTIQFVNTVPAGFDRIPEKPRTKTFSQSWIRLWNWNSHRRGPDKIKIIISKSGGWTLGPRERTSIIMTANKHLLHKWCQIDLSQFTKLQAVS